MKRLPVIFFVGLFSFLCVGSACASESNDSPKIFSSTNFGGIDFLFTEEVERQARSDGSNFQLAIREVGFDLISALGNVAKSVPGLQAVLISRINFKEAKSLVVLGVIVDNKFQSFNFSGRASNPAMQIFMDGLEKKHILSIRLEGNAGVEISLSAK